MKSIELSHPLADILIVDDTPANLRLLSVALSERGYNVRKAINGELALTAVQASTPDLILLDINMPGLNGFEVCKILKDSPKSNQTPIIFLTAFNEVQDKLKAFEVGGVDYITKPFQIEEVLVRIETHLSIRNLQKQLEAQNLKLHHEILEREAVHQVMVETQAALEASEARNKALLDGIPDLMFRIRADGVFLDYRPAKNQDHEQVIDANCIGKKIINVLSEDLAMWTMHYVEKTLATGIPQVGEYVQQIQGVWHHYEARYVVCGSDEVLALVQNISPRKQAEANLRKSEAELVWQKKQLEQALTDLKKAQIQLIQQEKMASLGQLIAGIAHEINNPISFISGNLVPACEYVESLLKIIDLSKKEIAPKNMMLQNAFEELEIDFIEEDLPKIMASLKTGSERISQIVQSLRNFSRLDEAEKKTVNIWEGIDSTLAIVQHRLKENDQRAAIEVIKNYHPLPKVTCYARQLNQVFMNLIINAIDALDLANPPHPQLEIVTEVVKPDWITIRMRDNGLGMSEEVRSSCFDPFFSTKPVGRGTGLGLSISYEIIVEKHGGNFFCNSTPGEGTEFMIEIPVIDYR